MRGITNRLFQNAKGVASGLHGGEISSLISLTPAFQWLYPADHMQHVTSGRNFALSTSTVAAPLARRSSRSFGTFAAASATNGGTAANDAVAEFDLTPPQTGILRIDGYDATGFIVGDVQVEGSIVCLGDLWLTWSARSLTDITLESLALLELTKPPPDLLVLGCGARIVPPPVALMAALRRRGVAIEALDTVNAVSTYNILNQEGRKVLGAMLPAGVED